ncbi:MAG: methyltransferase domain-containing protein [Candidatus Omnitrophica bacterium]|nr:methyltransferase domain-containing protein [Candidatus Omnitrophota bacterium]
MSTDETHIEKRLQNEVDHAKHLLKHDPGKLWGWESHAGKIRLKCRVKMLTSHIHPGMKVLEIGCGTGYFTKELAKTGAAIVAIDISSDLLAVARRDIRCGNVTFKEENAYSLSFPADSFDTIIGSSVLHHLDTANALAEFYRVLKKSGTIFFTEPNMINPQIILQKNIPALKRMMGDSPDETAFFRWKIARMLSVAGFKNIHIKPFDFLHPGTPRALIPLVRSIGNFLERVHLISEIAGSLYIRAEK